jgi:MoaA/NifB/PqqE/SkfB family radical SAM enzyme
MALSGVHLLLTYRCDRECDHCFVWGSPAAEGTMTLALLRQILDAAERMGTVRTRLWWKACAWPQKGVSTPGS